jgi:two-component SAPR family response regulator
LKNKRIVIVEDQPIVALDFQTFLKINGYNNVHFFISGKEAMEGIKNTPPDLAILDIKLKDTVTGLDIAEYLKNLKIKFIFVSAFSNKENYKKAVDLNPAKILFKPINHNALLNSINEVLQIKTPL